MSKVLVAVRIRPQSEREVANGSQEAVKVSGQNLQVNNVKLENQNFKLADSRSWVKTFVFDRIYWSVNPVSPNFATQEVIYNDLGMEVLSSTFCGYNACLFAYGQTGSGKTYTMMGNENDLGLIPRICQGLFNYIRDKTDGEDGSKASYTVNVSYMEIYKEKVCDLLVSSSPSKDAVRQHLRIREHPISGPYVEGLTRHHVKDDRGIQALIAKGNNSRTVAATRIHEKSSRSHAIFTIYFTSALLDEQFPSKTVSKINMVDLAGSERADATSAFDKNRMKEGSLINKSLTTLGSVIQALAKRSVMSFWDTSQSGQRDGQASQQPSSTPGGRRRSIFIPYRDSVLTWLLKDSLGGNSKTIMIATISPSDLCYSETVNTLHYAQRAKTIVNRPVVNEDPVARLIRDLREEIARLQSLLRSQANLISKDPKLSKNVDVQVGSGDTSIMIDSEIAVKLEESKQKAIELTKSFLDRCHVEQELLEDGDLSIKSLNRTNSFGVVLDSRLPHLICMDDDMLNTGIVLYQLKDGETKVGNEEAESFVDIVLDSEDIISEHCSFRNSNNEVTLEPNPGALIRVNDRRVTKPIRLTQGDVIFLGQGHMFRYNNPQEAAEIRERRRSQLGGDGRMPGALSRCSSLSSINTSSGIDVESPSDSPLSSQLSRRCSRSEQRQNFEDNDRLQHSIEELERLQNECRQAKLALMEKEEALFQTHEANRLQFEARKSQLEEQTLQNEREQEEAWNEIERMRTELEELRAKYVAGNMVPSESDAKSELHGLLYLSPEELEEQISNWKQEIVKEFEIKSEHLDLEKASLKASEERFRNEAEERLEAVNRQNQYLIDLENKQMNLVYFIEKAGNVYPPKFDSVLPRSASLSDCRLHRHETELSGDFRGSTDNNYSASDNVSKVSSNNLADFNELPVNSTRPFVPEMQARHPDMLGQSRKLSSKPISSGKRHSIPNMSGTIRSHTPDGGFKRGYVSVTDQDISRSSSYPSLPELCDTRESSTVKAGNFTFGKPLQFSSMANLASVPESLNEDFDEAPMSGKISASVQDLEQWSPVLRSSPWKFDALTGVNPRRGAQARKARDDGLSNSLTQLPDEGRRGRNNPNSLAATSTPMSKNNKKVKPKCGPSGDEESISSKDVHKISVTSGKTSESVNKRQSVPTKKHETGEALSQTVERKDDVTPRDKQPLGKHLPSSPNKDQKTVKVKSAKRSPDGMKTLTKLESGNGEVPSSTRVSSSLSPVNRDMRDKRVEQQRKTKSPNKASTGKKSVPLEPNSLGKTDGKRIFGENLDTDALRHGAETAGLTSAMDVYVNDVVSGSPHTVKPTPGALEKLERTCSTSFGKSETGKADDVGLRSAGAEFSDDSLDGEERLDDRTEFRPQMEDSRDVSDIPADRDLSNFDQSKLDVLSKITGDRLALQFFSDDSLNDENAGGSRQSRIISPGLFSESSPNSLRISADPNSVHGGEIPFDNPAAMNRINQAVDFSFLMPEDVLLSAEDPDGVENTSSPVKKAGKTGRRSGRRRVPVRPINTGASTTESDGNDVYDGMSDDSLTMGLKHKLPSHGGTHGSLKRKKRPHHHLHESSAKMLSDCSLADADYVSSEGSSDASDEDFAASRKSSIEVVGAKLLASTFEGASEDEPSDNSGMCSAPETSDLHHHQTAGSDLWTGDCGAQVNHTQNLHIGFSRLECWNTLDGLRKSAAITDGGFTPQGQRIPLGVCGENGALENEAVRAKNFQNLGFSRILVYDASMPLDSETLAEETLAEKSHTFASPKSVRNYSCLDTLTASSDEKEPVILSSDPIQADLTMQNSDKMAQPTNEESVLPLTLSDSLPSKETNEMLSAPRHLNGDDGLVALSVISGRPDDFYSHEGLVEPEQNLNAELQTVVLSRLETEDTLPADSHSCLKQAEPNVDLSSATVVVKKESHDQAGVSRVLVSENVASETVDSDHFDFSFVSCKDVVTLEQKPDEKRSTDSLSKSEIGSFVSVPGNELLEMELMSDVARVQEVLQKDAVHPQKWQSFDLSHGHIADKIPSLKTDRALLELSDSNETAASVVSVESSEQELTTLAVDESTVQKQVVIRDINENSQLAAVHLGATLNAVLDATAVSKCSTIAITNGVDVTVVVPSDSCIHGDSTEAEYDVMRDESKNKEFIRYDSLPITGMKQDLSKHVVSTVDAGQDGRRCGNQEEDEAVKSVLDIETTLTTTLGEANNKESENRMTSAAEDPVHQRIDKISENSLVRLLCEGHDALECCCSEDELLGAMNKTGQSITSDSIRRSCVEHNQFGSLDSLHKYTVCSVLERSMAAQASIPDGDNCFNGNDVVVKHRLRRSWSSGTLDGASAVHKELPLSFSKTVPISGDVGIKSSAIERSLHTKVKPTDGSLHNYGKIDHTANNLGTEKHANEEGGESCQIVHEQNISFASKISHPEILIDDSKAESLPESNGLTIHSLQQSSCEDRTCSVTVKVDETRYKKQNGMNQSEDVIVLEMKIASDTEPSTPFVDVEVPLNVDFDDAGNRELNAKRSRQGIDGMQNSEAVHDGLVSSNGEVTNGDFTGMTSQLVNGNSSPRLLLIPEESGRNLDFNNSKRIADDTTVGSEHKPDNSSLILDPEMKHFIAEDGRTEAEIYDTLCLDRNNKLVFPPSDGTAPAVSYRTAVDGGLDVSLPDSVKEVTEVQELSNFNVPSEISDDHSGAGVYGFVNDRETINGEEFRSVIQNLVSEIGSSKGKNLELGVLADPCIAGVGIRPAHDVMSDLDSGISTSEYYATDSTTDNEARSPARRASRESNNFQGTNQHFRVDASVAADDKEAKCLVSRPDEESIGDPRSCIVSVPCQREEKQSLGSEIELGFDVRAVEADRSTERNELPENITVNQSKYDNSGVYNPDSYRLLDENAPVNVVHHGKSDPETDDMKSRSLAQCHDKSFAVEISDYKDSDVSDVVKAYVDSIVASSILQVRDENIGEWFGTVCNEDSALANTVPSRRLRHNENMCEPETGKLLNGQKDIAEVKQSINATFLPDELDNVESEQDDDISSLATESEDTTNVDLSFSDKKSRVMDTDNSVLAADARNKVIVDSFTEIEADECSDFVNVAEVSYRPDYVQASDESLPLKLDETLAHAFSTENAKEASASGSEVEDIAELKDMINNHLFDNLEANTTDKRDFSSSVESSAHLGLLAVTDIDSDCPSLVRLPEAESKELESCSYTDGTSSLPIQDPPVSSFRSESRESLEAVNQTQEATAETTSGLGAGEIYTEMIETPAAAYALDRSTGGSMAVDKLDCHWSSTAGDEVGADFHLHEDLLHQEDDVVFHKALNSPLTGDDDDDDIGSNEETKFAGITDITKVEEDRKGLGLLNANLCSTDDSQTTSNNANSSAGFDVKAKSNIAEVSGKNSDMEPHSVNKNAEEERTELCSGDGVSLRVEISASHTDAIEVDQGKGDSDSPLTITPEQVTNGAEIKDSYVYTLTDNNGDAIATIESSYAAIQPDECNTGSRFNDNVDFPSDRDRVMADVIISDFAGHDVRWNKPDKVVEKRAEIEENMFSAGIGVPNNDAKLPVVDVQSTAGTVELKYGKDLVLDNKSIDFPESTKDAVDSISDVTRELTDTSSNLTVTRLNCSQDDIMQDSCHQKNEDFEGYKTLYMLSEDSVNSSQVIANSIHANGMIPDNNEFGFVSVSAISNSDEKGKVTAVDTVDLESGRIVENSMSAVDILPSGGDLVEEIIEPFQIDDTVSQHEVSEMAGRKDEETTRTLSSDLAFQSDAFTEDSKKLLSLSSDVVDRKYGMMSNDENVPRACDEALVTTAVENIFGVGDVDERGLSKPSVEDEIAGTQSYADDKESIKPLMTVAQCGLESDKSLVENTVVLGKDIAELPAVSTSGFEVDNSFVEEVTELENLYGEGLVVLSPGNLLILDKINGYSNLDIDSADRNKGSSAFAGTSQTDSRSKEVESLIGSNRQTDESILGSDALLSFNQSGNGREAATAEDDKTLDKFSSAPLETSAEAIQVGVLKNIGNHTRTDGAKSADELEAETMHSFKSNTECYEAVLQENERILPEDFIHKLNEVDEVNLLQSEDKQKPIDSLPVIRNNADLMNSEAVDKETKKDISSVKQEICNSDIMYNEANIVAEEFDAKHLQVDEFEYEEFVVDENRGNVNIELDQGLIEKTVPVNCTERRKDASSESEMQSPIVIGNGEDKLATSARDAMESKQDFNEKATCMELATSEERQMEESLIVCESDKISEQCQSDPIVEETPLPFIVKNELTEDTNTGKNAIGSEALLFENDAECLQDINDDGKPVFRSSDGLESNSTSTHGLESKFTGLVEWGLKIEDGCAGADEGSNLLLNAEEFTPKTQLAVDSELTDIAEARRLDENIDGETKDTVTCKVMQKEFQSGRSSSGADDYLMPKISIVKHENELIESQTLDSSEFGESSSDYFHSLRIEESLERKEIVNAIEFISVTSGSESHLVDAREVNLTSHLLDGRSEELVENENVLVDSESKLEGNILTMNTAAEKRTGVLEELKPVSVKTVEKPMDSKSECPDERLNDMGIYSKTPNKHEQQTCMLGISDTASKVKEEAVFETDTKDISAGKREESLEEKRDNYETLATDEKEFSAGEVDALKPNNECTDVNKLRYIDLSEEQTNDKMTDRSEGSAKTHGPKDNSGRNIETKETEASELESQINTFDSAEVLNEETVYSKNRENGLLETFPIGTEVKCVENAEISSLFETEQAIKKETFSEERLRAVFDDKNPAVVRKAEESNVKDEATTNSGEIVFEQETASLEMEKTNEIDIGITEDTKNDETGLSRTELVTGDRDCTTTENNDSSARETEGSNSIATENCANEREAEKMGAARIFEDERKSTILEDTDGSIIETNTSNFTAEVTVIKTIDDDSGSHAKQIGPLRTTASLTATYRNEGDIEANGTSLRHCEGESDVSNTGINRADEKKTSNREPIEGETDVVNSRATYSRNEVDIEKTYGEKNKSPGDEGRVKDRDPNSRLNLEIDVQFDKDAEMKGTSAGCRAKESGILENDNTDIIEAVPPGTVITETATGGADSLKHVKIAADFTKHKEGETADSEIICSNAKPLKSQDKTNSAVNVPDIAGAQCLRSGSLPADEETVVQDMNVSGMLGIKESETTIDGDELAACDARRSDTGKSERGNLDFLRRNAESSAGFRETTSHGVKKDEDQEWLTKVPDSKTLGSTETDISETPTAAADANECDVSTMNYPDLSDLAVSFRDISPENPSDIDSFSGKSRRQLHRQMPESAHQSAVAQPMKLIADSKNELDLKSESSTTGTTGQDDASAAVNMPGVGGALSLHSDSSSADKPRLNESQSTKRSLKDTEVLGLDLLPARPGFIGKSHKKTELEIVTGGRSRLGFPREASADVDFQFIGLQPLDKQPPKFSPECERILRDELQSPYRRDFARLALDIEIKPLSSGLLPDPTSELSVVNSGDVLIESDGGLFKGNDEEDVEIVEKRNLWSSETNLEPASHISIQESRHDSVHERHPSVVDGANSTPGPRLRQRYETDARLSSSFHTFDKKFSTGSRGFTSQTMDSGIWERTTSESELNQVSRLSPISANTTLSKSDEDLLGSESVLFEGIIPSFKALPSTIGSDNMNNITRNIFVEGEGSDRIHRQEFRQHFPLQDFVQERKFSDPDRKQHRSLSPKRARRTRSESSDSLTYAFVSHSDDEEHYHRLHQKRHKDTDTLTFTRTVSASEIFQLQQPSENFRIKSLQRSTSLDVLDILFTEDIAPENIFGPSSSKHPDVVYRRLQPPSQSGTFSAVRVSPILGNLAAEEYDGDANIVAAAYSVQQSEVNEPDNVLCNFPKKNDSTGFAYGRLKVQPLAAHEKASCGEKYRVFDDTGHSELLDYQQRRRVATSGAPDEYDRIDGTRSSNNGNSSLPASAMMDANQRLSLFRRLKLIDASTQSDSNRPGSGEGIRRKEPAAVIDQQSSPGVYSTVPGSLPQLVGGDLRERLCGRTEWGDSERLKNRTSLSQADLRFTDVIYPEHLLKRFSTSELPYRRTIETQTYPETRGIETQTYIWLEPGKKGVKPQTPPIDCLTYDRVSDFVSRNLNEKIVQTGFESNQPGIGALYPLQVDKSYNEISGGMLLEMGDGPGLSSRADDLPVGKGHSSAGGDSTRWKERASREVATKAVEPSFRRAPRVDGSTADSVGAGTTVTVLPVVHAEAQRSDVCDNTEFYGSCDARYQLDDFSDFSAEENANVRSERGSVTRDVTGVADSSSDMRFHSQVRVMMDSTGDDKAEPSPQGIHLTSKSTSDGPLKSSESFSDFHHGIWTQGTVGKSDRSSFSNAIRTQSDIAITSSPHNLGKQKQRGSQVSKKDLHDVAMRISFDEPCSYVEDVRAEFDTIKEQSISERYVADGYRKIPTPSHRDSNDLTNKSFSRQDQSFDPSTRISQPSFRHETSDNLGWSSVQNRTHYLSELSDLGREHNLPTSVAPGNISSGTQDSGVDDFRFSSPGETSCRSSVNFDFPTFSRSRFRFGDTMSAGRGRSVELERLRAERQRIVEMLARDIVPSKVQVDLAEAQLHYLIGQADLLLQTIDEHEDFDQRKVMDTMKAPEERLTDFGASYLDQYRSKLELARLRIERQIRELERKHAVSRLRLSELIRNDDKTTQMRYKQRKSEKIDQPQFSGTETNRASGSQRPCRTCGSSSINVDGLSPSQMQHYLMSIRREVVAATRLSDPTWRSTLATQSFGRINTRQSVNDQRQYASFSNLRSQVRENALGTSQDEWFSARDSGPDRLRRDGSRRGHVPFDDESSQLLDECQKVRRRAQNEISEAMKVLNKTSPTHPHPHSSYGSDSRLYARDKGQPFERSVQRDGTSVDHSIPLDSYHQGHQSLSTSSLPRSLAFDRSMFGNTCDILNSNLGGERNPFAHETKRCSSVEDLLGGRSLSGLSREHSFPSKSTLTTSSFQVHSSQVVDPPPHHHHSTSVGSDRNARTTGPLHSDRFARPVPFGSRRSGERTASGALLDDELGTSSNRYEPSYSVDARHFHDPHHLH